MMLVVDDILLFPLRGVGWIVKTITNAAEQELDDEAVVISDKLRELYMMLEIGQISDSEFDANEKELLDRLDEIENRHGEEEEDYEEEDYEEEDYEEEDYDGEEEDYDDEDEL